MIRDCIVCLARFSRVIAASLPAKRKNKPIPNQACRRAKPGSSHLFTLVNLQIGINLQTVFQNGWLAATSPLTSNDIDIRISCLLGRSKQRKGLTALFDPFYLFATEAFQFEVKEVDVV